MGATGFKFEHLTTVAIAGTAAVSLGFFVISGVTDAKHGQEQLTEIKERLASIDRKLENLPAYAVKITEVERRVDKLEQINYDRRLTPSR